MTDRAGLTRIVALVALTGAVVAAVAILAGGGEAYRVTFRFESAAQLVEGGSVQLSGRRVGNIEEIVLADDRIAEVTATIEDERIAPLPAGTEAVLRSGSLSGVANRYIDLRLPAGPRRGTLASGAVIGTERTVTNIDLDQLLNTFDGPTRAGLGKLVRGSGRAVRGHGEEVDAGWRYLNPSLVATRRLFDRLGADRPLLARFVTANAGLTRTLAASREQLSTVVDRLATATGAIGARRTELARAIALMPAFMTEATTSLAELRRTVGDLDPLVRESDPVVRRLPALLDELTTLARRSRTPARTLAAALGTPGAGNDLTDLLRAAPALARIGAGPVRVDGKQQQGAFPITAEALHEQTPHLAFLRPYAPDITGWFDDFAHSNVYDAHGHVGRVALATPAFAYLNGALAPVPSELRGEVFRSVAATNQLRRCPGATDHPAADGSRPWKPTPTFNCDERQTLPGG